MFPIIDKPVMQYLIEEAVWAGCEDIIVITWRNKRAIEDHFDSNYELEKLLEKNNKFESLDKVRALNSMANIVYVRQPYPRGDWEAILRSKSFIWNEPFLVLFWDDLIEWETSAASQLVEAYNRKNSPVIATIKLTDFEVSSYWILETNETNKDVFQVSKFLEKPELKETKSRNWSIWKYVLNNEIFDYLEEVSNWKMDWEIRLADAFELMRRDKDIYWVSVAWDRFDTWSKIGFLKMTVSAALKRDDLKDEFRDFLKDILKK